MEINLAVSQAHSTALDKGWWEKPRSPLEIHMLIVSEIAEATEVVRKGDPELTEPEELADAVIRIMDYFGHKGWDLNAAIEDKLVKNMTRPYRHGGKAF